MLTIVYCYWVQLSDPVHWPVMCVCAGCCFHRTSRTWWQSYWNWLTYIMTLGHMHCPSKISAGFVVLIKNSVLNIQDSSSMTFVTTADHCLQVILFLMIIETARETYNAVLVWLACLRLNVTQDINETCLLCTRCHSLWKYYPAFIAVYASIYTSRLLMIQNFKLGKTMFCRLLQLLCFISSCIFVSCGFQRLWFCASIQGISKKVVPLKLFGIFSHRLSLFDEILQICWQFMSTCDGYSWKIT